MKQTLVCDIECYRNYFLVMFRSVETGRVRHYEMFDGQPLDIDTVRRILTTYRIVTFNGMNYDIPMLTLALTGAGCEELKRASDAIIMGNLRSWQFEQQYDIKIPSAFDHIDISEVAPGVMISLKQYGARMHSKKLQDLPIEHDAFITPDQRQTLIDYCGNDLQTTLELWLKLSRGKGDVITIREQIGKALGIDLRSKSDAQMAEAALKKTVEQRTGAKLYKPTIPAGTSFKYTAPSFLKFESDVLRKLLADACAATFYVTDKGKITEPPQLKDRVVPFGQGVYAIGIGGLHSCEKSTAHFANDEYAICDHDVASFYPFLIKMCGLYPENIGLLFIEIYSGWINDRIAAKRSGNSTLAQTLKIYLNGLYGKLGSQYSIVYAPHLLIQVTLTGQLVLLMLIERLENAGIQVISANTDGIVVRCKRSMEAKKLEIIHQWEKDTGLETEETKYKALISRDVNNYYALKEKGGTKTKGVFAPSGLTKNVENEICNEAVAAFLEHGVPVEVTIRQCRDIRKFLTMRKVTGGGTYDGRYLGKVVRWYVGSDKTKDVRRKTANKLGNHDKVAGSTGAIPMMDLVEGIPADLDMQAYIDEANEILTSVGITPELYESLLMANADLFV